MALSDIDDLAYDPNEGDSGHDTYHDLIHRGLKSLKSSVQTLDSSVVKLTGDQTVGGTKTFSGGLRHNDFEWIPLTSPGFEIDGHWNVNGSSIVYDTTVAHSGTRSYRITGNGTVRDGISNGDNYIPVVANEIYYAEAWVKIGELTFGGTGTAVSLGATIVKDAGGSSYPSFWNLATSSYIGPTDWVKVSGTFSVPSDATGTLQIRPSVRSTVASGDVWFDDVRLARITPATNGAWALSTARTRYYSNTREDLLHPGQEIALSNPDFELTTGWGTGTNRVYDTTRSFEGTRSLKITATGPAANISEVWSNDYIAVTPGEQFYAEAYVWWEDIQWTSGSGFRIEAAIVNSSNVQIGVYPFHSFDLNSAKENAQEWTKVSGVLTVPANGVSLRMRCSTREGVMAGNVWFDRVRVRKLTSQSTLYYRGDKRWAVLDKSVVALSNADNTSDVNKPVSTAMQSALDLKQDDVIGNLVKNPGFEQDFNYWVPSASLSVSTEQARTGTKSLKYTGGTALQEAWTSDPIPVVNGEVITAECWIYHPADSTGQGLRIQVRQISNGGWTQASASGTGTPGGWAKQTLTYTVDGALYDAVRVRLGFNSQYTAYVDDVQMYKGSVVNETKYYRGDKTFQTLDKSSIGLSNANNTSDAGKPVSTAQQAALDLKQAAIAAGETFQYYRGDKTWQTLNGASVGLANVNNTSDLDKPISTDQQAALDQKLDSSNALTLTGPQTVSGTKTFSAAPKLGSTTVGYVWTCTNVDGSGEWQLLTDLQTTVDYNNITNLPTTFPPTIGTTADTAAAGNHTHTKASVGLGNVDNTSDLSKPISTAQSGALSLKVGTDRTLSTSSSFTGGGALGSNLTLAIANGGIDKAHLANEAKEEWIHYVPCKSGDTRAVGLNKIEDGYKMPVPMTITAVRYRISTADGVGNTTVELRKNGTPLASPSSSGTGATNPSWITGSWSFAAGDVLTVYVSAVGTTPGKGLYVDILGYYT